MALLAVGPGATGVGDGEGVGLEAEVGVKVPLQAPVCCALFRVTVQGALLMVIPVAAKPAVVPSATIINETRVERNL